MLRSTKGSTYPAMLNDKVKQNVFWMHFHDIQFFVTDRALTTTAAYFCWFERRACNRNR